MDLSAENRPRAKREAGSRRLEPYSSPSSSLSS